MIEAKKSEHLIEPGGFCAGIDGSDPEKGFSVAVSRSGDPILRSLFRARNREDVVSYLEALVRMENRPLLSAAVKLPDFLMDPEKRDRQSFGYLLDFWRLAFPEALLFASLPGPSWNGLYQENDLLFPVALLAGEEKRKEAGEYLDAVILARTALRALENRTVNSRFGTADDSGRIRNLERVSRLYTLCIVTRGDRILLGKKKRGFGEGKWNGFGGKVHEGETLEEAALRELREESCIEGKDLEHRALIRFSFDGDPVLFEGHVFHVPNYSGTPMSTEEMEPAFFSLDRIPYEGMWTDDRIWLPFFLQGRRIRAHFHFDENHNLVHHSLHFID